MGGRLLRGIDGSEKSEGVGLSNVNVPTKEWISLMGASAEPNKNQSVSPSSWSVQMKHVPNDSDMHSKMRSAGTLWFFSRSTRSPTHREDEGTER